MTRLSLRLPGARDLLLGVTCCVALLRAAPAQACESALGPTFGVAGSQMPSDGVLAIHVQCDEEVWCEGLEAVVLAVSVGGRTVDGKLLEVRRFGDDDALLLWQPTGLLAPGSELQLHITFADTESDLEVAVVPAVRDELVLDGYALESVATEVDAGDELCCDGEVDSCGSPICIGAEAIQQLRIAASTTSKSALALASQYTFRLVPTMADAEKPSFALSRSPQALITEQAERYCFRLEAEHVITAELRAIELCADHGDHPDLGRRARSGDELDEFAARSRCEPRALPGAQSGGAGCSAAPQHERLPLLGWIALLGGVLAFARGATFARGARAARHAS